MRKYLAISVGFAFLLFMATAMAQEGATGSSSQYPSASSGQSSQAGQPSESSGSMQGENSSKSAGKTRTVEGCIAQEQTDYFLIPKNGNPILLQASGSENPSGHVGHRVKVKGNEQAVSAGSGSGMSGGAAGTASSSAPSQQSGAESNPSAVGSQASQPSGAQSGAAGGELRQNADKEISVDKITMVSETCPADWNSKYKSQEQSKPSSSQAPPQF